jgi:hypothetical protein
LYRDVKHELTIKIEVRDGAGTANEEDIEQEELYYTRLMNELRNLKETK